MPSVLLLSNRRLDEEGGRPEKFRERKRFLEENGWEVIIGYVRPPGDPRSVRSLVSILQCIRTARKKEVDVVNSVSEPMQLHIVGYIISRLVHVPWIMEFRDPLAINPEIDSILKSILRKHIEAFLVRRADQILWFYGIQIPNDYFSKKYSQKITDKITQLPSVGYSRKLFEEADEMDHDSFIVTYAGSFYSGWIEPYPLFEAIAHFTEKHPQKDIQFHFYGDWEKIYTEKVNALGISESVFVHGWVEYADLVPILKGSDILLYIGGSSRKNRLNIPSKLYDYIGAETPIIGIVDESFRAANFIREHGIGLVASPDDPSQISDSIEKLFQGSFEYQHVDADRFSHENVLEKIENVYSKVVT